MFWVGPGDPVAPMRGDVHPIAGTERTLLVLVGESQPRRAGEEQDKFRLRLIVPEPGRALLPERDDAFDAQPRCGEDCLADLAGAGVGQIAQQVPERFHGAAAASTPATARRHPAWRS